MDCLFLLHAYEHVVPNTMWQWFKFSQHVTWDFDSAGLSVHFQQQLAGNHEEDPSLQVNEYIN